MKNKRGVYWTMAAALTAMLLALGVVAAQDMTPMEQLGEALYLDTDLSQPDGQSCESCHALDFATVDPDTHLPVSEGVIPGLFGNRNAPMADYAMYVPAFHWDEEEGLWFGGLFWDGRATGADTGDPLADQALGPPLNPVEMHNPDKKAYMKDVKHSTYKHLFQAVWGKKIFQNKRTDEAYLDAALSTAAFERSAEFARFNSKYDLYLHTCLEAGGAPDDCSQGIGAAALAASDELTEQEWQGLLLFVGANDNDGTVADGEGAGCSACHAATWTHEADYAPLAVQVPGWAPEGMVPPIFTDHSFDNLGTPKNPDNPWYDLPPEYNPDGADWIDYGLGGALQAAGYPAEVWEPEIGKHRVMTLRNIGITTPYLHNGIFETLLEVTHFYNARDVEDLGQPEVAATVNGDELGNLGLSPQQEAAIVAFMETLSDGYWQQ